MSARLQLVISISPAGEGEGPRFSFRRVSDGPRFRCVGEGPRFRHVGSITECIRFRRVGEGPRFRRVG